MKTGEKFNYNQAGQMSFEVVELANAMRKNAFLIVGSWGAHNWKNFENKCLSFNVDGMKLTGQVHITLAWNDTFTVYFTQQDGNVLKVEQEVYVDELIKRIDLVVET